MKKLLLIGFTSLVAISGKSQIQGLNITGNIESIFQYLNEDALIDADQPPEKGLLNTYMNTFITYKNLRLECV